MIPIWWPLSETMAKAKAIEAEYERLNFREAALVDSFVVLYIDWGSGAFGLPVGSAGFLGYSLRPEWIASLLGT
jgi:hypothetical protein